MSKNDKKLFENYFSSNCSHGHAKSSFDNLQTISFKFEICFAQNSKIARKSEAFQKNNIPQNVSVDT